MTHPEDIEKELDAIRDILQKHAQGMSYPKPLRERVARLTLLSGLSRRAVAKALGVGAPTVAAFINEMQGLKEPPTERAAPAPRTLAVISAEREKHHREIAERLRERDERLRNRPAYCFNIDLLGDPPPGRSALDRRKSA